MDQSICKLTISCARLRSQALQDALETADLALSSIVRIRADMMGSGVKLASTREKVSGAMETDLFVMIVETRRIDAVKSAIGAACAGGEVSLWAEPVLSFERLMS